MELTRLIATRRSLRAFSNRPVEPEKIERMLEAARRSPSSGNRQPWRFVVVFASDPVRSAVEDALEAGNAWAKKAPVLIVSAGRAVPGTVVESRQYHLHDSGIALMSLLFRGVDQGLLVHPMAGWKEVPLRIALGLPDDVFPIALVAVGYSGRPEELDEATRKKDERPNTRKELGEIAFRGRWGEPYRGTLPAGPRRSYETDIPLRFGDIDAMGHVNNAVTVTLLEAGRFRFFADVLGAGGIGDIDFILAETLCRYKLPILLQDPVRLRMHITDVTRSSFRYHYVMFDPRDGRVFVEAETVQVSYDYAAGRPKPLSSAFLEKAADYIGG
jgi:acyl-CoA thioesterase FadM/nitroreductase